MVTEGLAESRQPTAGLLPAGCLSVNLDQLRPQGARIKIAIKTIRVKCVLGPQCVSVRFTALCKRCICYGKSVRLSVCPVRHTSILCQN